jgi:hypothetical protein
LEPILKPTFNESPQPVLELNEVDIADLATVVAMNGMKVLQKIMRHECDVFIVDIINATNDVDVLAKHKLAKAAAQYYTQVVNRINEAMILYRHAPKDTDKPLDSTEGIFDIGEVASSEDEDEENFLGGEFNG